MIRRAFLSIALLCTLGMSPVRAQDGSPGVPSAAPTEERADSLRTVSLSEALRRFRRNNLSLRRGRAAVREAEARRRQARAYPNPHLQVTHEPLRRGDQSVSETYFNLSQPIEWRGRGARLDAARHEIDAARARTRADSARQALRVAEVYLEAAATEQRLERLRRVATVFRRADSSFGNREVAGEASGYARQRVRLERARSEQRLATARLAVHDARRRLALLIRPDERGLARAAALPDGRPPAIQKRSALRSARRQRPELARWTAAVEARQAARTAARREGWPDPTVTAGYKRQSNGFEGAFLGLDLPLPLFDRNRGEAEAEAARLDAAQTERALARREIENEVRRAHRAYVTARRQSRRVGANLLAGFDDLLRTASVGYEEGEMSLLELLDAADAYRDAQLRRLRLRRTLWTRYFELLHAMGQPLDVPDRP
jgi:cobalt-zinc-cadmium efflux system outer membrane protein